MKQSNFSVSELLIAVVDVFSTIAACKDFASCKFGYGFIARSAPKFRAPKWRIESVAEDITESICLKLNIHQEGIR